MKQTKFKYSIIKFSSKDLKNKKELIKKIGLGINKSFDYSEYETFYCGNFEKGIKLLFFETLTKATLKKIHNILKDNLKGYGCYFLDDENFTGCIKELLFKNGCFVKGEYKK